MLSIGRIQLPVPFLQAGLEGYSDMPMRKNYPVEVNRRSSETETASVVGPLCTPLDLLADRVPLNVAEVGDLVVVFQSGAYGASASPSAFLGQGPAREMLI